MLVDLDMVGRMLRQYLLNKVIVAALLSSLVLIWPNRELYAASYECKDVKDEISKVICDDPELSDLDERLASSYKEYVESAPENKKYIIKRDQWRWLLRTRAACAAGAYPDISLQRSCLAFLYGGRTAAFDREERYGDHSFSLPSDPRSLHYRIVEGERLPICEYARDATPVLVLDIEYGLGFEIGSKKSIPDKLDIKTVPLRKLHIWDPDYNHDASEKTLADFREDYSKNGGIFYTDFTYGESDLKGALVMEPYCSHMTGCKTNVWIFDNIDQITEYNNYGELYRSDRLLNFANGPKRVRGVAERGGYENTDELFFVQFRGQWHVFALMTDTNGEFTWVFKISDDRKIVSECLLDEFWR
jgi:uncharacterized protein YecT (DUF1311 family)